MYKICLLRAPYAKYFQSMRDYKMLSANKSSSFSSDPAHLPFAAR
jgi:hypothetical protein